MTKTVFIAYTPYHIFLAMLMAFANRQKEIDRQLVIIANFADAPLLYDSLNKSSGLPFSKIKLFAGEFGLDQLGFIRRGYKKFFGEKNNCRDLLNFVKREDFRKIFIFNEDRPSALYLLRYVNSTKGKISISFVEDGAVTYNSFFSYKSSQYLFFGKIAYGLWWKNVAVMGTSDLFDSIWALFPEYVRAELKNKRIERIPSENISAVSENGIAVNVLKDYGMNPDEVKAFNCIVLLSHSSVISKFPDYKAMLLRVIKKAQELGYSVAVKYHPRDNGDFLNLSKEPNVTCLRASAPLELIYLLARDSIRLVIADISTTVLSALVTLPKAKVVSTGVLLGSKDDRFISMLNSLGVKLPKTFEEFDKYL